MELQLLLVFVIGITLVQSGTSPKLIYPLCDVSGSYEIKEKEDGIYPTLTDCFLVDTGERYTSSARHKAIFFDGTSDSYVNVEIPSGMIPSDEVGFSLYVKPILTTGTIFYYKADGSSSSKVAQIKLYFDADNMLILQLMKSNGDVVKTVNGGPLETDEWSLVQFGYNRGGRVDLRVNGQLQRVNAPSGSFLTPGEVFIGSAVGPSEFFQGAATCLLVFDKRNDFPSNSETADECKNSNDWGAKPGNGKFSSVTFHDSTWTVGMS
ncbi:hypothetical protein SNE40_004806 [Patella caerulea]|uniref:Uncharacterized protein n=1 Tax=Patella caerulea TaxID=87958 RepID=A0AAN8KA45_PATCE